MKSAKSRSFSICGVEVQPGEKVTLALATPEIYTCAPFHVPMHVIHGRKEGPRLLICATQYGNEVNGIAILQKLLHLNLLKTLQGTLIAIPVMNVYGLIHHTKFLPDEGDLLKNFPGSRTGSFTSRLAHLFSSQILQHVTHCINIQSGAAHIYKLPQVCHEADDDASKHLAEMFEAPVIYSTDEKTGFFSRDPEMPRCPTLIFRGGEAERTDDLTIRTGLKGIIKVMRELHMVRLKSSLRKEAFSLTIKKTSWIRAPGSGLFSLLKKVGTKVEMGERLAVIIDPFGTSQQYDVVAKDSGVIIAVNTHPLVNEGQGIVQLGYPVDKTYEVPETSIPYEQ
jgi:predicted deacylase